MPDNSYEVSTSTAADAGLGYIIRLFWGGGCPGKAGDRDDRSLRDK